MPKMTLFKEHNISLHRKALREIVRVKRDLVGLFHHSRFRLIQRRYDKNWPSQIRVTKGVKSPTKKIAIFVLFQPGTLRKSTIETCNHLASRGYAVLAVSNAELTEVSRKLLSQHVYQICERPNYGYDAGAYRDGVWMLRENNLKPDRLVLMNDSILFPLTADNSAIDRLETNEGVFGGLVRKTNNKMDIRRKKETSGFIEAYFYQANLSDKKSVVLWNRFWDELKLTEGRKYLKEDRISMYFTRAGVDMTALGSRYNFLREIDTLTDSELRKVLQYAAYTNPTRAKEGAALNNDQDSDTWRAQVLHHIRETAARYPFHPSFVYGSEKLFSMGFIKRSNSPLFRKSLRAYYEAVKAGDLPAPTGAIMSELEAICDVNLSN